MTDSTVLVLGASSLALAVILYLWWGVALAALLRKAGVPVWKAWVPVVNVAVVLKLGGFSPWLVLLNIIPLFGAVAFVVVFIVSVHRITVDFDRGAGMTVVGALFPAIWASILGFGSARWQRSSSSRARPAIDEDSAPVRRGADYEGPYVPLIGGWTPDAVPSTNAGDDENGDRVAHEPVSEPVALPFAAPSGSLADAVPSSSDWAPPTALIPAHFDGSRRRTGATPAAGSSREGDERRASEPARGASEPARPAETMRDEGRRAVTTPDAESSSEPVASHSDDGVPRAGGPGPRSSVPTASVFAVLDALRDDAPRPDPTVDPFAPGTVDASRSGTAHALPDRSDQRGVPDDRSADLLDDDVADSGAEGAPWAAVRRTPRSETEGEAPIAAVPLTRPAAEPGHAPRAAVSAAAEEFPELSEAVSAVSEAPEAGSPRSARTSVSALYTQPELPGDALDDDLDALDRTVVTRRKRIPWSLIPPSGAPVDLTSSVVILGRRPAADPSRPDAQLVPLVDDTRTVSKTHARLELRGDTWFVTDLDSTNGVLFATLMGTEVEATPGEEIEAGERFFLGDAEVRLTRRDA